MLTFGDRNGLGCSGYKVCMSEISCTKAVGCSACKNYELNTCVFSNKQMLVVLVAR